MGGFDVSETCRNGHVRTSDNTYEWADKIECRDCRREANQRVRNSKRRGKTYGDNRFAGNGVITCFVCGNPVRDHSLTRSCVRVDPPRFVRG